MDEGIIFEFLHSFQLAKLTKSLFKDLLCDRACQVPHKKHFHLVIEKSFGFGRKSVLSHRKQTMIMKTAMVLIICGFVPYLCHDFWVWVLNGISPLHSDQISPHLHLSTHQPSAGLSCCFVIFILQKAKAPIPTLIFRLLVQYDII